MKLILEITLSTFIVVGLVCAEMFSSGIDVRHIFEVEKNIVDNLKTYLHTEELRIEDLEREIQNLENISSANDEELEAYLSNPSYAFMLIRENRLEALPYLLLMSNHPYSQEYLDIINPFVAELPTSSDLEGSAAALFRLQDDFNLTSAKLANGQLPGLSSAKVEKLSAKDCYDVGVVAFRRGDFKHTLLWMNEALERIGDSTLNEKSSKVDILRYTSYSHFKLGNIMIALQQAEEMYELDNSDSKAANNIMHYRYILKSHRHKQTSSAKTK